MRCYGSYVCNEFSGFSIFFLFFDSICFFYCFSIPSKKRLCSAVDAFWKSSNHSNLKIWKPHWEIEKKWKFFINLFAFLLFDKQCVRFLSHPNHVSCWQDRFFPSFRAFVFLHISWNWWSLGNVVTFIKLNIIDKVVWRNWISFTSLLFFFALALLFLTRSRIAAHRFWITSFNSLSTFLSISFLAARLRFMASTFFFKYSWYLLVDFSFCMRLASLSAPLSGFCEFEMM